MALSSIQEEIEQNILQINDLMQPFNPVKCNVKLHSSNTLNSHCHSLTWRSVTHSEPSDSEDALPRDANLLGWFSVQVLFLYSFNKHFFGCVVLHIECEEGNAADRPEVNGLWDWRALAEAGIWGSSMRQGRWCSCFQEGTPSEEQTSLKVVSGSDAFWNMI